MQPLHMDGLDRGEPAAWFDGLAPGRRERGWRCADIARTGAVLGLGSDWMVADYDPRVGMAWARLRREPGQLDRTPYLPEQALSPARTLHGYTTCPAAITGDRDRSGRLAPGMNADVTVLEANPLEVAPDELPDVPVVLAVVNGEVVHRFGKLSRPAAASRPASPRRSSSVSGQANPTRNERRSWSNQCPGPT